MKRIGLVFMLVMLVVSLVAFSAMTGVAQDTIDQPTSDQADTVDQSDTGDETDTVDEPSSDETDTGDETDTVDEPSSDETGTTEAPICTPEWFQEWHPDFASGWWWFWWYQWCWTSEDGWFRSYDGWDWGPPIWG